MKGIYLIVIAFLASRATASVIVANRSTFEEEDECPAVDDCPPKLMFHKDCNKYYECQYGEKIEKTCLDGLVFSLKYYGCVDPTKTERSECCESCGDCTTNGELIPHECKCTQFYECKNKQKVLRKCRAGQYFDKDRRTCIPGHNCKPIGTECEDGELLPHECQCSKYYYCKKGLKALRECSKGSYFDAESSNCVKGTCPKDDSKETCHHGEKKEHDCSCEKYYTCKSQEWILQECQNGQHFSPTLFKCIKSSEAGCEPTSTPPTPSEPGKCPAGKPTRWPHECDCRLYYVCENDEKKLLTCAWGRYFDYTNQVCDLAEKVSSTNVGRRCKNNWDNWIPA